MVGSSRRFRRGCMVAEEKREESEGGALTAERRKRDVSILVLWGGFMLATLLFPGSPADGLVFCPFRALTSWSCPGCGMTRSCTALVRGEVWTSLEHHPLGWLVVVWFTAVALWRGLELWRGERLFEQVPGWLARLGRLATVGVFVFILLFGGVRLVLEIAGILTPV